MKGDWNSYKKKESGRTVVCRGYITASGRMVSPVEVVITIG